MKNKGAKGATKERQSRKLYEEAGWIVIRAAGSLGPIDFVALKRGERPRLIQVKASSSPWMNFRPAERAELLAVAKLAGATPELAWWGPRARTHILFDEAEWPHPIAA